MNHFFSPCSTIRIPLRKFQVCFILLFIIFNTGFAQTSKPNIVLILGDDIGYKSLSFDGGTLYSTPNLDTLANAGMRFTQCHTSPLCCPSRTMLLTGKYNFRNYTEWNGLDPSNLTFGDLFSNAGYKTAFFGKSQLNAQVKKMDEYGFENYAILTAHDSKYKSPAIYTNNGPIKGNSTEGQYSEDIFTDSVLSFIHQNKDTSFFIFYPMILVHKPFQPTPDDSAYETWSKNKSDTTYYPSMIQYMDKKIGLIINKVKEEGLENNTLILYLADNGTSDLVKDYVDDDSVIYGGKKQTTESGTHVPFIAYWPGVIEPGSVNNNLIDLTDFFPTLASICHLKPNQTYEPLDGVDFSAQLFGKNSTPRDWVYCYFDSHPGITNPQRWAQTTGYKLYDTSAENSERLFYNIIKDPDEENPIPDNLLTPEEVSIKSTLLNVINGYTTQGFAILEKPVVSEQSDSSSTFESNILTNGGSTIKSSGFAWGLSPDPTIETANHIANQTFWGAFKNDINGLIADTTYYVRSYATNAAGIVYSDNASFSTLKKPPFCLPAQNIHSYNFTADWLPSQNTSYYRFDLSTSFSFTKTDFDSSTEGFDSGTNAPLGWSFSRHGLITDSVNFGNASPSISFQKSNTQIITSILPEPAKSLSFWIKASSKNNVGPLVIEGYDGKSWVKVVYLKYISKTPTIKIFDSTSTPALPGNLVRFRFTYTKDGGTISLDDISMGYTKTEPSLVQGYAGKKVFGDSLKITGLNYNTTYYYRVRAFGDNKKDSSLNSNVIKVITKDSIKIKQELHIKIFPNPFYDQFTLKVKTSDTSPITILITNSRGSIVYKYSGKNNVDYYLGNNFADGNYFIHVWQNGVERKNQFLKVSR